MALAAVLGAAAGATYLHRQFASTSSHPGRENYGRVFQQYVTRFTWFVGPVSGSYAVYKLVEVVIKAT